MPVPIHKIRILGKDYTLRAASARQFDSECFGLITYSSQEILYSNSQGDQQLRDTVIHESLHGIDYAVQAKLKEKQVHAIASGLYAWMAENKRLVRWIIGDEP